MLAALDRAKDRPRDSPVRWRVLEQFKFVTGREVKRWDDDYAGLQLTPEAMATRVFDVDTKELRDRQEKGATALAIYVRNLDAAMQPLMKNLDKLLEEQQPKHGDARR